MRLVTLLFLAAPLFAQCTGYGNSLPYQLPTVAAASMTAPVSTYPVFVYVTDARLKTTANGGLSQSAGNDIRFADESGAFILQSLVTYSATAGVWEGYIQTPGLSAYGPVNLRICVGKASDTSHSSSTTFPTAIKAMYPMQENGLPEVDSSQSANNSNGGTAPTQVAGNLGALDKAQSFNGSSQFVQLANPLTAGTDGSLFAYVKAVTMVSNSVSIENRVGGTAGLVMYSDQATGHVACYIASLSQVTFGTSDTRGAWHAEECTCVASTKTCTIYIDGAAENSTSGGAGSPAAFQAGNMTLGKATDGTFALFGGMSHMQIISGAESASTVAAKSAAFTSPSTFAVSKAQVWGGAM